MFVCFVIMMEADRSHRQQRQSSERSIELHRQGDRSQSHSTATAGTTGLQQVAGAAEININPRLQKSTHRQKGGKSTEQS